jgi:SAM-dependent methyltransferase
MKTREEIALSGGQVSKDHTEGYDSFYARGGWHYDESSEKKLLQERLVNPLALCAGARVLEIGCGIGLHSFLLHTLGFNVVGIDSSSVGIERAQRYPEVRFLSIDAQEFLDDCSPASFDVVFSRGMSWFHYEFEPKTNSQGRDMHQTMTAIMRAIIPGGVFVLQICTDFTGDYDHSGARNHTWTQSTEFFSKYGTLVLCTDWNGIPLESESDAGLTKSGLIIAVRRRGAS